MNKAEAQAAYDAGRAFMAIQWPEDAPEEQRKPGVQHCPFPEGDPQRAEWLRGLQDALGGNETDRATILKEISDEIKSADDSASKKG